MRELISHQVNGVNDGLTVWADDEPGSGGANHVYAIQWTDKRGPQLGMSLHFQNGSIKEVGVNGVTHEALLAILIDRLEGFQSGPYACPANRDALACLRNAQQSLLSRTRERAARGVEGTMAV